MLGQRIKETRKLAKLTQEQFGKKLNVGKSAVSQWESGTNEPSAETLNSICTQFHVTLDYLYGKSSKPDLTQIQEDSKKRNELSLQALIDIRDALRRGERGDIPEAEAKHLEHYLTMQIERIQSELNAQK